METHPIPSPDRRARRGRPWLVGASLGLGFAALFAAGLVPRLHQQAALAESATAAQTSLPTVSVARAERAPASATLELPGEIKPYQEAAIFARATGYLRQRHVDIGDRVRAGQLLAEVESPEVEKELLQARAALGQAEANWRQARTDLGLARTTAQRWRAMRADESVSQQDADEKQAAYQSQRERVASMEAAAGVARSNMARLESLARFRRVVAPFTGTITSRGADPGALIGNGAAGAPLFKIVQLDRLRIDVAVPQTFAPAIARGQAVQVVVRELGKSFRGNVIRTAGALDPATRTLQTQVELANDGKLMPGMFANVKVTATRSVVPVQVPGNAIVTRATGAMVAVVKDDVVRFRPVALGQDDGAKVEIRAGLTVGEVVVIGPSDDVKDGSRIRAVPFKEI